MEEDPDKDEELRELVSKIIKRIEPPPAPPEPTRFEKHGGWANARPSAGGAVEHLSPDESAAARRAGAEALVKLQNQQDARRATAPVTEQHLMPRGQS